MKIEKNKKLDIAYVQFRKGTVYKTVKALKNVLIDLDKKGNILGIEVLSLSALAPTLKFAKRSLHADLKKAA